MGRRADSAGGTHVVKALSSRTCTPVSDRVIDEFELIKPRISEIGNTLLKRSRDRCRRVRWEEIHLQEALYDFFDFDQVGRSWS